MLHNISLMTDVLRPPHTSGVSLQMERYLGADPAVVVSHFRSRDAKWFVHADAVAAYASKVLRRLEVHRGNVRELLASLLFQRVAAGFEAVLLLAERGMHTQGLVQRRSMLEALFVLGAIWQKPQLAEQYLASDDERVLQIYKKIKRLPSELRAALEPEITPSSLEAKIAELKGKTSGRKPPTVAEYAEAADLLTYYLTDYAFSSEAAHHVAKDLERQIHLDEDGNVNGMGWGPEDVAASELLLNAIDYVLMACFVAEKLFNLDPSTEFEKLHEQTNAFADSNEAG